MRLLIVDDEELTRAGLIQSIDWEKLGICEVYEANDGVNGFALAQKVCPDIVLCDVRMPRMDGIEMLRKIEKDRPEVVGVFMSGYSDKEYLKAAIRLKAVNYIEKPINNREITETIKNAIDQVKRNHLQAGATLLEESQVASRLAYLLTAPYQSNRQNVDEYLKELKHYYKTDKFRTITTFIVKLQHLPEDPIAITEIYDAMRSFLRPMHLHVIYTEKRVFHIIFHVFGEKEYGKTICRQVAEQLGKLFAFYGAYYISVGETVDGVQKAYTSYDSAVILLQDSFFREPGTILFSEISENRKKADISRMEACVSRLENAIREADETQCENKLKMLEEMLNCSTGVMPNQVRSQAYNVMLTLYRERKKRQMVPDISIENQETILDMLDKCFSFRQMKDMIQERVRAFFQDISDHHEENPIIFMIQEYIRENYSAPSLSVKSISEYIKLSASYVCTFFKNETGSTLNQYITDYRMNKARQLLADPRIKISEISSRVGYHDGNYFAKSFRKMTGLSPTEYRERATHP